MISLYLIGGGWNSETFSETYGRFLKAATEKDSTRKIAIIVAEEVSGDSEKQFRRFFEAFETVGLLSDEAEKIIVSKEKTLTKELLKQTEPSGVFVCGGLTPAYFEGLCVEKEWLEYLFENEIPYCGFSAGSSIASKNAIIGGWRREINKKIVEITDENASEDLDLLDVREGLGLADFTVEVHASQWGTFSRLVHAVDAGLTSEGWAIDENTMLEITNGKIKVFGAGNAYHLEKKNNETEVEIF